MLDVTCACAGLIEALHVVAEFALHDEIRTALVCAGEITRDRVTYDIQSLEDVAVDVAGLTLGNATAAAPPGDLGSRCREVAPASSG